MCVSFCCSAMLFCGCTSGKIARRSRKNASENVEATKCVGSSDRWNRLNTPQSGLDVTCSHCVTASGLQVRDHTLLTQFCLVLPSPSFSLCQCQWTAGHRPYSTYPALSRGATISIFVTVSMPVDCRCRSQVYSRSSVLCYHLLVSIFLTVSLPVDCRSQTMLYSRSSLLCYHLHIPPAVHEA